MASFKTGQLYIEHFSLTDLFQGGTNFDLGAMPTGVMFRVNNGGNSAFDGTSLTFTNPMGSLYRVSGTIPSYNAGDKFQVSYSGSVSGNLVYGTFGLHDIISASTSDLYTSGVTVSGYASNKDPLSMLAGTAATESYAATGAAATMPQLLYMIWSKVAQYAISNVTMTTKKVDQSTPAMTFTLDNSGNPTSITRTT